MSLFCQHCGAPRQTSAAGCPYCKTLYASPGVIEAIDAGNLIEAVRLYRAATAVEKMKASRG